MSPRLAHIRRSANNWFKGRNCCHPPAPGTRGGEGTDARARPWGCPQALSPRSRSSPPPLARWENRCSEREPSSPSRGFEPTTLNTCALPLCFLPLTSQETGNYHVDFSFLSRARWFWFLLIFPTVRPRCACGCVHWLRETTGVPETDASGGRLGAHTASNQQPAGPAECRGVTTPSADRPSRQDKVRQGGEQADGGPGSSHSLSSRPSAFSERRAVGSPLRWGDRRGGGSRAVRLGHGPDIRPVFSSQRFPIDRVP